MKYEMKTIEELLPYLQSLNVKLWVEDGKLRYRAPKGAMTATIASELKERKSEILNFLSRSYGSPIQPVPDQESYELSHAQQRLWVLSQIEEGTAAYNIPLHQLIEGELAPDCLREAFNRIIQRHESLRTSFITVDGEPRQKVHDKVNFTFAFQDLSGLLDSEETARKMGHEHALKPFDLEKDVLFRVSVLKLTDKKHVLLFTIHHIIADGVSIGLLVKEISLFYESIKNERPNPLLPLRIQYRDYAYWQNALLVNEEVTVHRNYWHKKLSGKIPVLDLALDFPRPPVQSFNGKEIHFNINKEQLNRLHIFCRQQNVSLFMALLAALKVLLYRYTGQDDIVVGSPIAGRNHMDLEGQIGLYLNTLPFRSRVNGELSFKDFLGQVRQTALEAYDHEVYPFDRLVDELNIERDLSRSPMFDVMIILQNQDDSGFVFEKVKVLPFFDHPGTSKLDLTFCFKEINDGLVLCIEYNTDLFMDDRIKRMGNHLIELLNNIVADPYQCLDLINIMSRSERKQLICDFNNTALEFPRHQTIVDLFEAQVERVHDDVAIMSPSVSLHGKDRQFTYRELNSRANQLAHHLRSLGVESGVMVGVCMERALEMLVGLLGILKSGGTYVPLDPAYPKERLGFMLDDAQLSILVTQEKLVADMTEILNTKSKIQKPILVCLDKDWPVISQMDSKNPVKGAKSDKLGEAAYVIYTSGSTGKPKGVQINHDSLVNFLTSMLKEPGLLKQDILLAVTTLSFDISALELFLPLIAGAKVILANRETASDGLRLIEVLNRYGVTVMQATPASWRLLLAAGWKGNPSFKIISGGEALSRDLSQQLLKRGSSVWNLYGPTETTIWSTIFRVEDKLKNIFDGEAYVPIGRPIANTQIFILDRKLQPVPIGVFGELYIGGAGLARGYLNRPELTAEKFIPNPFKGASDRLYKTGDLARFLQDGNIEFKGRLDYQVKIRGFRIETGEIEATLTAHPNVKEAVVIVREDHPDDKCLVAYVVEDGNAELKGQETELRNILREKLPEYMVPSAFVIMDSLPLTQNGKVNRQALPIPGQFVTDDKTPYVAPRSDIEQSIADAWKEVLNVERVGIYDDFFELGGHSLKATKVLFKIRRDMKVDIRLVDLFRKPTVSGLADIVHKKHKLKFDKIQSLDNRLTESINEESQYNEIAPATLEELELLE